MVRCSHWDTDENGNVTTVYCTYDPATRGGECERKIKGTIHWLNAKDAKPAEIRLYEDLLLPEAEGEEKEFTERLNPNSLTVVNALVEPELAQRSRATAASSCAPATSAPTLTIPGAPRVQQDSRPQGQL